MKKSRESAFSVHTPTPHVLETAVTDSKGHRAHHFLLAREQGNLGIAKGESFEDVVVGGHDVEELVVAPAVENHFAIAGCFDGDGLLSRALQGKRPGAAERPAQRVDIVQTIRTVKARMDKYRVAGLGFVRADRRPIAAAGAVVGVLNTDKARLLARAFMVGGIHVQDASALIGFRFGPCGHSDALLRLAADAVRITERELAFVAGGGLEIQDAPRKAFGHAITHLVLVAVHPFPTDTQQRERRAPGGRAHLAEADRHAGIPVGVPLESPFESEVQERRMFYMESAGAGGVLGLEGADGEEKQGSGAHGAVIL